MSELTLTRKIGSFNGIPVEVTASWVVIATLVMYEFTTGTYTEEFEMVTSVLPTVSVAFNSLPELQKVIFSITIVLSIYGSILLHEFGHSVIAEKHGYNVKKIKLWLLGGVANIDLSETSAREEFEIAAAGPAVTIGIICVTASMTWVCTVIGFTTAATWFGLLTLFNTAVVLFNLIPVFPLDGGRITRSVIQWNYGKITATKRVVQLASIAAGGMIIYAVVSFNLIYLVLAGFIVVSGMMERKKVSKNVEENIRSTAIEESIDRIYENEYPIRVWNETNEKIDVLLPFITVTNAEKVHVTTDVDGIDILVTNDNEKTSGENTVASITEMSKSNYDSYIDELKTIIPGNEPIDDSITELELNTYNYWPKSK